jgi:hypothetical protein
VLVLVIDSLIPRGPHKRVVPEVLIGFSILVEVVVVYVHVLLLLISFHVYLKNKVSIYLAFVDKDVGDHEYVAPPPAEVPIVLENKLAAEPVTSTLSN